MQRVDPAETSQGPCPAAFRGIEELGPLPRVGADILAPALGALRRLAGRMPGSPERRWRRENPGARFSDYYAARVGDKLASGGSHPTLGRREWSERQLEKQRARLELLRRWGLKPHHRCIEYGCGSLRVGRHLIRYLDPERYVGLDVTDCFFLEGVEELATALLRAKRPELYVIDPDLLAELREDPPDFVVSFAVLHHVHPSELDEFLENVARLIGPSTHAILSFREARRAIQTAAKSWSHPPAALAERLRHIDPALRVAVSRGTPVRRRGDPSWKSTLRIVRAESRWGRPAADRRSAVARLAPDGEDRRSPRKPHAAGDQAILRAQQCE